MKYAKIRNGKVVHTVQGSAPDGYVLVIVDWTHPTEYPLEFYSPTSTKPISTVTGEEVHETCTFTVKSIDKVKSVIYKELLKVRDKKRMEPFVVDGVTVILRDRSEERAIANIGASASGYKYKEGKWIKTPDKINNLKVKAEEHVQAAYDWEMEQNDLVDVMTTHNELKAYFESL